MRQHTSIVSLTPFGGVLRLFTCSQAQVNQPRVKFNGKAQKKTTVVIVQAGVGKP